MIEFKIEEGQDPKEVLLEALPPLDNLTIESLEQIDEPMLSVEPLTNSIN